MTIRNLSLALITLMGIALPANAQYAWQEYDERMPSKQRLDNNIGYKVEMQSSFSKDKTPLWLNANKHGLSSLDEFNGYVRGAVMRPLSTDSPLGDRLRCGRGCAGELHVERRSAAGFRRSAMAARRALRGCQGVPYGAEEPDTEQRFANIRHQRPTSASGAHRPARILDHPLYKALASP